MKRLKELRTEKNLSQAKLANLLGIQQKRYSTYETGTAEPSIEMLKQLSAIFNVSIDYLVENDIKGKTVYNEEQRQAINNIINLDLHSLQLANAYLKALTDKQNF